MGPTQLQTWLAAASGPALLLDVREAWEYELCRLDGSRLIPLSQLPARIGELDQSRTTVVICHHGVRSLRAAAYLEHCGFDDVVNLSGGIDAWARTVDRGMAVY
ncbi:MAG TPA: rhodanese-like domain-containing protein [Usitatibacteraceae bacterium]|nr:rhodanese-like domain-containing protein [Usitatibacteraceae bacterium]